MPNYRRAFVPGGCWFFTVTLLDRRLRLLTENIDVLRKATRITQARQPFTIDAIVVLPDHIHAVWSPGFWQNEPTAGEAVLNQELAGVISGAETVRTERARRAIAYEH